MDNPPVRDLDLHDVLVLYATLFECTVEQAGDQVRSRAGLEGALARPRWYREVQASDLAMQAAVLTHGIAESQSFVEGNKRVALIAMATFLLWNGFDLNAPEEDQAQWILDLSAKWPAESLATEIRQHLSVAAALAVLAGIAASDAACCSAGGAAEASPGR